MNIEQLEYVVEVAKSGSISVAAERLHVSQSGISQAITNLENELGYKIFNRSRFGTFPTGEGKELVKKAYEIIMKIREINEDAKTYRTGIKGELKISVIPNMMMLIFNTLRAFRADHPGVHLDIREDGTSDILKNIQQQKSEFGLINITSQLLEESADVFVFEQLLSSKTKVFIGKTCPLAYSDSVTVEEIRKYPLVLYKSDHVKQFVTEISQKFGPLNILFTTNSNDAIKEATVEGLGIGIGTSHLAYFDPYIINGDIITLDIVDYEQEPTFFGLIRSKDTPLSAAAKKFIQLLKEEIRRHTRDVRASNHKTNMDSRV